ncbi:MAG: hypothetical protein LQ342_004090 [Letrouitia transgressa]|nr:MAG: hypothetical protein LQ342_004090 [Letrouitia transgressa]
MLSLFPSSLHFGDEFCSRAFDKPLAKLLLGHANDTRTSITSYGGSWTRFVSQRLDVLSDDLDEHSRCFFWDLGYITYALFLQSNITGPPLAWDVAEQLQPLVYNDPVKLSDSRRAIIQDLGVDGEAVYQLIPNVELFALAKIILNHDRVIGQSAFSTLARIQVNFLHQRLLNENSATLQKRIYNDLDAVKLDKTDLLKPFLIFQATIHTHHGFDRRAREDLESAAKLTGFQFVLTGRLGKRTKYQDRDLSQLVVLAKSNTDSQRTNERGPVEAIKQNAPQPQNLDLNDETLLESISFTEEEHSFLNQSDESLPPSLASLDPSNQPALSPLDSIILLSYASSIIKAAPVDGLTREGTLPYATRVLQDGSSNWQIYSHALLVRSRIECYKSRTVERSVLQLQALVDQIITEITPSGSSTQPPKNEIVTSFLPRSKPSESASVSERLLYINELVPPTRWELEAELASRWVSLGGLRTALEIYERLQMWAEVALCWAASNREEKSIEILKRQLYESSFENGLNTTKIQESLHISQSADFEGKERDPLPPDAPRLFCILGDLKQSVAHYERAWEISSKRYARAQRSLGKHYFAAKELRKADEAYSKALKINALDHGTWFVVGCVRLQLEDWVGAVEAFSRALQIEERDAESWSNMAAALMRLPPELDVRSSSSERNSEKMVLDDDDDDADGTHKQKVDPQRHVREAFVALKRATALKRDSYRLWQNLLHVGVKLVPPPYTDIVVAQSRVIELLGSSEGEKCVDSEALEGLIAHLVITERTGVEFNGRRGFENMLTELVIGKVEPLITSSRRLWQVSAKLHLYLQQPRAALAAYEKAWRVTVNRREWEEGDRVVWEEVLEATVELIDAYENLGEREEEREGDREGERQLVAKDWRFKARSAIRGIVGRGKEVWSESEGIERLEDRLNELRR